MKCTNCLFDNPAGAKFCQNCGRQLEQVCQNCRTSNAAAARFCMSCGSSLALDKTPGSPVPENSGEDPRHVRLAAAAPAPLAAKIRAAVHLPGERRVVTALFADVVGSTALAEGMDPEDWTGVMNRAFDLLTPAIYRYEGTIARLMGDALLAFFGAPVAHEDDPVRAVRAGLDLVSMTREYAGEVRRKHGIDFAVRVGLNTGPVVVGEVGSNLVYEYTAMGDAVNLASRMQSAARPMTVLISENTHRFVAPYFECADMGPVSIKGKLEPVRVYEVLQPKIQPGKARGLAGLESPMVGREAELNALLTLEQAVRAGLGRVAIVSGEAGLGKSRLIAEWRVPERRPGSGEHTSGVVQWAEGRCLSYGQGLAYHLLVDLLRSLIGVSPAADEADTHAALLSLSKELFGEGYLDVFPFLGHLLSLQLEGPALDRVRILDPQALQTQYLASLRQFLRALASRRPLVLILEDIHWADPSSTDLLARLLSLANEAPLMFCCLTRPDQDTPGWKLVTAAREMFGAGLAEINLTTLSDSDSRKLVSNLLEIEALPEKVRELILRKAEGNPFFVEEVIRMLIDRGAIVHREKGWLAAKEIETVEIPDSLQGLLLARIDRLPEDVKHTLRVASVIGRQFPVKVLEQVLRTE